MTRAPDSPGLHVLTEANPRNPARPITVIVQRHQLAPHDVMASIRIATIHELQQLMRRLKAQHDRLIAERRARVSPESCRAGGPVPRRPTLDEMDGE